MGLSTSATWLENSRSTFRLTNGVNNGSAFSPKLYKPSLITGRGWGGGSRAAITTYKGSNFAKVGGTVLTGVGIGFDAIGVIKYYQGVQEGLNAFFNPVHPGKAALNTGVAVYGLWFNPAVGITLTGLNEHCGCDASAYLY